MNFSLALLLFVLAAVLDICWAKYVIACSRKSTWKAALWAGAIYLPNGVSTPVLAHHPIYVIPLAIGAMVGTYIVIKRDKS